MKIPTAHEFEDMLLSLFQMDAGDKIDRHAHPFVHTTGVARGKTLVEIWYPEGKKEITFEPGMKDFPFPPDVDHQITAIEDGTIIVNLSKIAKPKEHGKPGVIISDDS